MSGFGLLFLFGIMLLLAATVFGLGLFAPTRLAVAQVQVLALIHGGVTSTVEETYVDGCVLRADLDGPHAVTRTRRTVGFRDGTSIEVVFSAPPNPTNAQCP